MLIAEPRVNGRTETLPTYRLVTPTVCATLVLDGGGAPLGAMIDINNPGHEADWFDIIFDRDNLPPRAKVSLLMPAVAARGKLGGKVPVTAIQPGRGWWRKIRRLPTRSLKHELRISAAVERDPYNECRLLREPRHLRRRQARAAARRLRCPCLRSAASG